MRARTVRQKIRAARRDLEIITAPTGRALADLQMALAEVEHEAECCDDWQERAHLTAEVAALRQAVAREQEWHAETLRLRRPSLPQPPPDEKPYHDEIARLTRR